MGATGLFSKFSSKKTVIDWGTTALKVISSVKEKHGNTITNAETLDPSDDVVFNLKQLWKKKNFSYSNIILCIDGPDTLIRVVDFPRIDKKSIRESLGFELEHYTPFSQNDVYFDYAILEESSSADRMKLLIVLIKRAFLDEKLELLAEASLSPRQVTLNPVALTNAFESSGAKTKEAVAIFDLGYTSSMITIVNEGKIVLSREIKRGTKDIFSRLQKIVEAKVTSFKDLNIHKHRINRSVLYDVTADVTADIKMSLDFIETKENIAVSKILVTGGMNMSEGMWDVFSSVIGVETLSFDIFKNFRFAPQVQQQVEDASVDFTVALSALLD